jgi:hypothetical protein
VHVVNKLNRRRSAGPRDCHRRRVLDPTSRCRHVVRLPLDGFGVDQGSGGPLRNA